MMGYNWGMDGWGWLPMLIPTLFWVSLIGLGVWAILSSTGLSHSGPGPVELLSSRYARGDISREEYLERRRDLS